MGKQSVEVAVIALVPFASADELVFPVELIVQKVAVAFLASMKPPGEATVV